jgi:FkbM family methyltransferase
MTSRFQTAETRHGRMVVLAGDVYIGRSLLQYGEWTEDEIRLLSQLVRPGDDVIDAGANVGAHTLPLAACVAGRDGARSGEVYAYEPQPQIFQLLSTNCVLNDVSNVRLYNEGCAARPGEIEIGEPDYAATLNFGGLSLNVLARGATVRRRKVQVRPLDDTYDGARLRLIKVDVEGMEAHVLAGASRIVARFRPALYVENDVRDKSPALIRAIWDLGYDAWWHVAPLFSPANFRRRADNVFGPACCFNMLCLPREAARPVTGLTPVTDADAHPLKP